MMKINRPDLLIFFVLGFLVSFVLFVGIDLAFIVGQHAKHERLNTKCNAPIHKLWHYKKN
uniref:Uncharacterized protein n=1 Tax=Siphoviridae sp. ctYh54 TaxID=2826379 RepID=A0A8S5MEF4_9CAUD|nr:MAG TPA: hypothetical protein [Siphoviridae sp. ctYh54]